MVCCTLSGALHPQLDAQQFDVVVIDEAAQALEAACWSALLKGRRAVLAGARVCVCDCVCGGRSRLHACTCAVLSQPVLWPQQGPCDADVWADVPSTPTACHAGDHLQLPPTVLSEAAAKAGLSCTLFERLQASVGPDAGRMLLVQYRMHSDIMGWSSDELYEVRARARACACRLLARALPRAPSPEPPRS